MRLAALVLLAASAIAVPTRHPDLRPLERDLRDMEVAIEALHAKAAHKALRLEKMDDAPLTITVRVFDEAGKKTFYETEFVEVTLSNSEGQHTVGKLREIIAKDRKWPSGGDIAKSPVFKEKTDEKNVLDEEKVLEDDEETLTDALGTPITTVDNVHKQTTVAMPMMIFATAVTTVTTPLEHALRYVEQLEGTRYGWWTGGVIPAGAPAWALDAPPPPASEITNSSCFCAGIPNLMLRAVGRSIPCLNLPTPDPECGQCCGGTGAYGRNFSSVATPFDLDANYSRGTLLGRPYRSVHDQGHVTVLLGNGRTAQLLQSYSSCAVEPCPIVTPGVTSKLTLEQAYSQLSFCRFTYAIAPEHWMVGV